MNKRFSLALLIIFGLTMSLLHAAQGQNLIIKPKEIDDVLINPGVGFTTFHHFNGDHLTGGDAWAPESIDSMLQSNGDLEYFEYPPTSIAYFRWYWDEMEPEQGNYNWELIDETIERARQNGQTLAFRVMPQNGTPKAPKWYREIAPGFEYGESWMPDYEDPLFKKHYGNMIKALAERYDGHPIVDHIDMGIVGRWGEWHSSQTGHPMPSMETQIDFVDMYLNAFSDSLLVMLIGGDEALAHAVKHGCGWRADCLGDVGGFSENWNHMEDMYPIALAQADAQDVWKTAPVVFESCWTMQHWVDQGWDVERILERALYYHTSVFNNKSSVIPKEHWGLVNDFLRRMGYRFVLRRLQMGEHVEPGSTVKIQTLWENIGVAPCYHSHQLVYNMVKDDTSFTHQSKVDIREWLPGYQLIEEQIHVPNGIPDGWYTLRVALLDPNTQQPAIRLAIEGREDDGWYTLGQFRVN